MTRKVRCLLFAVMFVSAACTAEVPEEDDSGIIGEPPDDDEEDPPPPPPPPPVMRNLNLTYVLSGNPKGTQYPADSARFMAYRNDTGAALSFPISVPHGTTITITPLNTSSPKGGVGFRGWNSAGPCAAYGKSPCVLTMTTNRQVIGVFCQDTCIAVPL